MPLDPAPPSLQRKRPPSSRTPTATSESHEQRGSRGSDTGRQVPAGRCSCGVCSTPVPFTGRLQVCRPLGVKGQHVNRVLTFYRVRPNRPDTTVSPTEEEAPSHIISELQVP